MVSFFGSVATSFSIALYMEIKSKQRVTAADASSLETLGRDTDPKAEKWLLSTDDLEQQFGQTRAMPWRKALTRLFGAG